MLRGSGVIWDLRIIEKYDLYNLYNFHIPIGNIGDCYDRYLIRVEELRSSVKIILNCLNKCTIGETKAVNNKLLPSRYIMKSSMESTIQHFKMMSAGLILPEGELYNSVEAPKGEFGVYVSSSEKAMPDRIKFRAPGFYHLQGIKCLSYQHLLADVVTIIGTADIVFGEVDR